MKSENSHLIAGMIFGALIGACSTYFIIKNQDKIKREFEHARDKVKDFSHRAKERAEEFTERAEEKMNEFGKNVSEKANNCLLYTSPSPRDS